MNLTITSNFFPKQHLATGLFNGDMVSCEVGTDLLNTVVPLYLLIQYPRLTAARKKIVKLKKKRFISFKKHAKQ
jgi:hypothetical protein